jgi:hypothetical protein
VIGIVAFGYALFKINPIANADVRRVGALFATSTGILLFSIALFDHYLWTFWPGLALSALSLASLVRWTYDGSEENSEHES